VFVALATQKRNAAVKLAILVLLLTPVVTTVYSITRAGTSANNTAYAVSPSTLNFQARLLTSSGNLVPDGIYNVEFKIYNASTSTGSSQGSCTGDANCLWTETRLTSDPSNQQISVKNGYLSVYLGDKTALPANIWNQQLYLTMNIGGTSGPTWDGEMTPRIRLTSVPFAFRATVADSAETLSKNTGSFTGTVDFSTLTADRKFLFPDTSLATTASPGTICVYNGATSNCPAATGSAYYIHNDTGLQTTANFNIQGADSGVNGTVVGVLRGAAAGQTVDLLQFQATNGTVLGAVTATGNLKVASSVDVYSAGTLSVGTSTATAITVGKAGITTTIAGAVTVNEAATFNDNVTVAASKTLRITGNNTAGRPVSPAEGTLYFDTDTKQLLVYANGKWQGDRSTATKIVAASNSSQAVKDAADYVATGTSDQTVINAALTAGAGGKVYLSEGIFTADDAIQIPNNTTLVGSGANTTTIQLDAGSSSVNLIENKDSTATGVSLKDITLDGNLGTGGTQNAIYLDDLSDSVTNNNITGVTTYNWTHGAGLVVTNSSQIDNFYGNTFNDTVELHYSLIKNFVGNYVGDISLDNATINTLTGNTLNIFSADSSIIHAFTGNRAFSTINLTGTTISTFSGNTTRDITTDSSGITTLSGNTIVGNITVTNVSGIPFSITNNTFDSNNLVGGVIDIDTAANMVITGNNITNFGGSIAIKIGSSSNGTYLSGNVLNGGTISDSGTGTIYGGQVNSSGNFLIQPAGTIELIGNTNVTGNLVTSGDGTFNGGDLTVATTTATNDTIKVSVTTGGAAGFLGTITNADLTAARTWILPDEGGTFCMQGSTNCGFAATTGGTGYIQNQNAGAQATSNFWISGSGQADTSLITPTVTSTGALSLTSAANGNITVNANGTGYLDLQDNVVVAAQQTIRLVGGTTAQRPGSPTEGMLYFDTDTKQLVIYANGKWQADRSTATKIVGTSASGSGALASNNPDGADYVNSSTTSAQTTINSALTAVSTAGGGSVYLMEGTYIIDGSISLPSNVTLIGSGPGTIIKLKAGAIGSFDAIVNSDTSGGNTYVAIKNIRLNGNKANVTSGTQHGISFNKVGTSAGAPGAIISDVIVESFTGSGFKGLSTYYSQIVNSNFSSNSQSGVYIQSGANNTVSGNILAKNVNYAVASQTGNNTITGNNIDGSSTTNYNVLLDSKDVFTGNYVTGTSTFPLVHVGINSTVSGNTFYQTNNAAAIWIDYNVSKATVSSNSITVANSSSSANGILLNGSDNVISGNNISSTSSHASASGIRAVNGTSGSPDRNQITDNKFSMNASSYGITLVNGTSSYLAGNTFSSGLTISDSGTTTVYAGQFNATTYAIQPSSSFSLTGNAASTVSTTSGDLTLQGGSGTVTLGSSTSLTATGALSITSGGANALSLDAGGTAAINIGGTSATSIVLGRAGGGTIRVGQNGGTVQIDGTNFDVSTAGIVTLAGGQTNDIITAGATTLKIDTGGSAAISLGVTNASAITIGQAGVLTTIGGNITFGNAAGSGVFTNNGATLNTVKAVANDSDGGALGGTPASPLTAAQSVDIYTSFTVNQTTASQTITLPSPTNTAAGRLIYIANIGSASFGLLGSNLNAGATATLLWNGTAWTFAGADGTSINNQKTAGQNGDFWIQAGGGSTGVGRADGGFTAPSFDSVTGVLNLGTTNATNITIGHNGGTFAVDGTNFDLSTAGVLTLAGGQTNDITTQANQNLTVQANGTGTIVLNDTVTANGTMTFSGVATDITTGTNEDLTVVANGTGTIILNDTVTAAGTLTISGAATDITTATNEDLTVVANGTGTIVLNDTVTVAGTVTYSGIATDITTGTNEDLTIDANGTGKTIIKDSLDIGASAGSGTTFTNNGSTVATTLALSNFNYTGASNTGTIGSNTTTVDIYTSISIAQTQAPTQTLTIPTPTASTVYGRIVYIANIGTAAFNLLNSTLNPGATATIMWAHTNGGDSWIFAGADGTSINNQKIAGQNGDFWIQAGGTSTGVGRADGGILAPSVDTATGVTLNLGVTTATAISLGKVGVTTTSVGNLTLGASAGSGTLFVNNGATLNTVKAVANDSDGGSLGGTPASPLTAAQSVDIYTSFTINQTTAGQTITLPSPTSTTAGRLIYIANIGSASFGLLGSNLNAGSTATLLWNGTAWTFAGADGTSINNQKTAGQNGDFWIQAGGSSTGIGRADGGLQAPSLDTSSAAALNIGTTSATNIAIGHNAGTIAVDGTNFDLSTSGVLTLAGGQTKDITTASASTATGLTVKPGDSTGSNVAGAILTLQGGAATAGNANGGAVTISGGAGVGTGTQGLVNLSTSAFTSATEQAFASSTSITAGNVNLYSTLPVKATATGLTLTVPDPAQSVIGRILYISARSGSSDFTMRLNSARTPIDIAMKANSTATLIWNGTDWTAAGASSSTDLQSAYNNTLTSAGGAELVLNAPGGNADGLTIRNNATTPVVGGLLEVQTSVGSNIISVNNNATEYAANGGSETAGGSSTTFPANTWTASPTGGTQATISRTITSGEFATGIASAKVVTTGATTANQGIADQIAVNGTNTALTANLTYTVSFTVKTNSNFNTLDVVYSKDGTNTATTACKTGATATESIWSRISCTFTAPSSGITSSNAIFIRQSNSNSAARTFFIDNLSVNVNANTNLAVDGSADSAANIGAGALNWGAVSSATVAQSTSTLYDTAGSVSVTTSGTAGRGVYNKLSNNIVPSNSTQYRVSFYAKGNNTANLSVTYTPDNGTTNIACQDYNAQAINASSWTLISCYFTTTTASVTNAQVRITQASGAATIFYVDALNVNLNNNNANNVQIGGANLGGPTTLLTLDRSSTAPIAANNDAYLGSMYYDTTTGRIQCYEADGWGACGSSPDNIITLTPEYPGAVLGGPGNVMGGGAQIPGIGVMTSEFCSSETGILVVGTLCANHEARNYYHWTSPQTSQQIYSIYVVYKLPTTFKAFNDSNTIKLTSYTDSLTNGIATLQVFRKNAAGTSITACGTSAQTINTSTGTWQQTPYDAADETTCGFAGGDNIIFKIDMKSQSNGNVYVENLDFVYTNN
jgi:hypothetical protein